MQDSDYYGCVLVHVDHCCCCLSARGSREVQSKFKSVIIDFCSYVTLPLILHHLSTNGFTTCNVTENFFHKFLRYSFVSCHDWYTVKFLFLFSSVYSSYKYAQPIMPFSVTIFLNSAGCTRSCSKSFQKNCPVTNNLQGGCNSTCSHTLHRCCWKYCK